MIERIDYSIILSHLSYLSFLFHYYSLAAAGGAELGGVEALQHRGRQREGAGIGDIVIGIDDVFAFIQAVDIDGVVAVVDCHVVAQTTCPHPAGSGADWLQTGRAELFKFHILHIAVALHM